MVYQVVAILLFVIAVTAVYLAFKLLSNKKWIAGFLRGSAGFIALSVAIFLALMGKDIFSYKSVGANQAVATLSFHKKEANTYLVEIQESSGKVSSREIEGQQWQLNVRAFEWPPLLGVLGLKAGYKLEDIAGRFLELQLDKLIGHNKAETLSEASMFDTWKLLNAHPAALPLLSAYIATPGFIPMADGAIYDVMPSGKNLSINPVNDAAKNALKSW